MVGFVVYFIVLLPVLVWWLYALILRKPGNVPLVFTHSEMLIAVILAGALGSYIHAATSFASYAGNRRLHESWVAWYLLRPFMGMGMALVFYLAARGGLLVLSSDAPAIDPYGMMTVAAMAGMFSKQASDKLAEVFDTLFKSRADDERKDKMDNPLPKLSSVDPKSLEEGSAATVVTVAGVDFMEATKARFNGQLRDTEVKSATELGVNLTTEDLAKAGTYEITAVNPAPGGGISNPVPFVVTVKGAPVGAPVPVTVGGEGEGGVGEGQIPATWFGEKLLGAENDEDDDPAAPEDGEG